MMTTTVRAHEPSINDEELDGVTGGLSDTFRGRYQLRLEGSTKLL
jgi:hypothetical protein